MKCPGSVVPGEAELSPPSRGAWIEIHGGHYVCEELCLCLFQREVQPNRVVRLDVAVLPGNAGSVQQQRVEFLGIVADVPQGFILEKKPMFSGVV